MYLQKKKKRVITVYHRNGQTQYLKRLNLHKTKLSLTLTFATWNQLRVQHYKLGKSKCYTMLVNYHECDKQSGRRGVIVPLQQCTSAVISDGEDKGMILQSSYLKSFASNARVNKKCLLECHQTFQWKKETDNCISTLWETVMAVMLVSMNETHWRIGKTSSAALDDDSRDKEGWWDWWFKELQRECTGSWEPEDADYVTAMVCIREDRQAKQTSAAAVRWLFTSSDKELIKAVEIMASFPGTRRLYLQLSPSVSVCWGWGWWGWWWDRLMYSLAVGGIIWCSC